jgi:hypothetical protein
MTSPVSQLTVRHGGGLSGCLSSDMQRDQVMQAHGRCPELAHGPAGRPLAPCIFKT